MRLVNTSSLELHEFELSAVPPYAILSHTWEYGEVTFADMGSPQQSEKQGYTKIAETCQLAQQHGLEYVWIDTCTIDKSSSAELSEAINSMFRWYQDAQVCFVYLADVSAGFAEAHLENSEFRHSRWFRRGWTLQEMIAPRTVKFYNRTWTHLGERSELSGLIDQICGVPKELFPDRNLMEYSIAQRMSWAADRITTRGEDASYCLLGLFAINMPLLYGEGKEKAFRRLQEAIIRQSDDQTIFAWGFGMIDDPDQRYNWDTRLSPLAKAPADFTGCHEIVPCNAWVSKEPLSVETTGQGIRIALPIQYTRNLFHSLALLNCRLSHDFSNVLAIPVCMPSPKPWPRRPLRDWLEPNRFDNIARCAVQPTLFPAYRNFFAEPKLKLLHYAGMNTTSIIHRNISGSLRIQSLDHIACTLIDSDHELTVTTGSKGRIFIREEVVGPQFKPPRMAIYMCHRPDLPAVPLFFMLVEFSRHRVWSNMFLLRERVPRVRLARPLQSRETPSCQEFEHFVWKNSVHILREKIDVVSSTRSGTGVSMNVVRLESARSWRWCKGWDAGIGRFFLLADDTYHFHATPVFSSFPWPIVYLVFGAVPIWASIEYILHLPLKTVVCLVSIGNLLFTELLIQTVDRKYGSRGLWVWFIILFWALIVASTMGLFKIHLWGS